MAVSYTLDFSVEKGTGLVVQNCDSMTVFNFYVFEAHLMSPGTLGPQRRPLPTGCPR